jgi:hypothetical protein
MCPDRLTSVSVRTPPSRTVGQVRQGDPLVQLALNPERRSLRVGVLACVGSKPGWNLATADGSTLASSAPAVAALHSLRSSSKVPASMRRHSYYASESKESLNGSISTM